VRPRAGDEHAIVVDRMHGLAAIAQDVRRRDRLPQLHHPPAAGIRRGRRRLESHPGGLRSVGLLVCGLQLSGIAADSCLRLAFDQ